jgi:hypothetical protein
VLDTVDAALGEIEEAAQRTQVIDRPTDALTFLRAVYQNSSVPLPVRIRCAVECLPFESPKLSATAIVQGQDFAALLDARLKRISEAQMMEGTAEVEIKPTLPSVSDRRFRRA